MDAETASNGTSANWCKNCRARYQKEWQATRKEMSEARAFHRGAEAMRGLLADGFAELGYSNFSGYEIADTIRQAMGPKAD